MSVATRGLTSTWGQGSHSQLNTHCWKERQGPRSDHTDKARRKKSCDFAETSTSRCWLQGMMHKLWSKPLGCVSEIRGLWEVWLLSSGVSITRTPVSTVSTFNSSTVENIYTFLLICVFSERNNEGHPRFSSDQQVTS